MRAWVSPRPWAVAQIPAAHFHTTRPSCLLLNSGSVSIKRKKPLKPLPLPKDWEPFQITETLLNLDAYEARGVREFDAIDEAEQKEKWSRNAAFDQILKEVARASGRFEKAHHHFERLRSREHSSGKWRVNDMDILGAALFYPVAQSSFRIEDSMAELKADGHIAPDLHLVLAKNGIPRLLESGPSQLMEWLIKRNKDAPPFDTNSDKKVHRQLRKGQIAPYLSWRRLILHLLRPGTDGYVALSNYHLAISFTFRAHYTNKRVRDLLVLLGNIRVRLEQEKKPLPGTLCQVGLALAAILEKPKAMESYLHVLLVNHFEIVSPNLSLYDVSEFPPAVVRSFDEEVLFRDTDQNIYELVRQQALRNGDLKPRHRIEMKTDQGHGPDDETSEFKL